MKNYEIAGLQILMECYYPRTIRQSEPYRMEQEKGNPDIKIHIPKEKIEEYARKNRQLDEDNWEYMITGSRFYHHLVDYDGMMLHASAVVADGYSYLFSADSGIGKSTHTGLWKQHLGDHIFIINDDKPAIRKVNGEYNVFGTPWSGKTDQNVNAMAKLGGIAFLQRSHVNWMRRIDPDDAFPLLLKQTIRKLNTNQMDHLIQTIRELLCCVPVYEMGCNMSREAVLMSYETMHQGIVHGGRKEI